MALQLKVYPRGFMTRPQIEALNANEVNVEIIRMDDGDRNLNMLYEMYAGRSVNTDRWAYRSRVIAQTSSLFGDFRSWIYYQLAQNNYCYGLAVEFLEDTLNFIITGQRVMSARNWYELLLEFPEENPGIAAPDRITRFQEMLDSPELTNVFGKWCSHHNGFEDMLWTARVLFGAPKKPLETRSTLKP